MSGKKRLDPCFDQREVLGLGRRSWEAMPIVRPLSAEKETPFVPERS